MAKDMTKVRKATVRKALTKELNALRKLEAAFIKARVAIEANSQSLTCDTLNQMAQVFTQLNTAIVVADSAAQDKATRLARTFLK
jgi:nitrate reductase NapAB chaperone NapD